MTTPTPGSERIYYSIAAPKWRVSFWWQSWVGIPKRSWLRWQLLRTVRCSRDFEVVSLHWTWHSAARARRLLERGEPL